MFAISAWCAEICLILSALYHLLQSHSHQVEQFWHGMDLLGIVIATVGTFSSGIYYVFFCEAILQKLHWVIVSLFT
jgi:adiponectin receptor